MVHFTTTVAIVLASVAATFAQNVISIDSPQVNTMVNSKQIVNIAYTVIGSQAVNPPFNVSTTYPASLSVDFMWIEHANTSNTISFSVTSGLNTDPYPGGLQTVQRKQTFRVPNCHFFSRYPPTTYDFQLVFTPQYPSPSIGTTQSQIIVPLAVTVDNSTFPKC